MTSSGIDGGPAAMKRAIKPPPSTVSPNKDSPAGMPKVNAITRMVCTIAMARRSALYSAANVITWASAPGLAPNSADCASQP